MTSGTFLRLLETWLGLLRLDLRVRLDPPSSLDALMLVFGRGHDISQSLPSILNARLLMFDKGQWVGLHPERS
ncbi:hypothetical protein CDL15_Pgr027388 [Punica granatum]|uniref:Uncharacterized protein n=1 Tax=Punica granatum TaxID=22663 RepID=A0A218Y259_PUNGR|nr:hypothetical protein CDL15_Pgr027388 [Punica granatum]